MRTFLDIQNDTLKRTGDDDDQDKMRELVKTAINTVHRQVLTERRYQFMLWPKVETLTLEIDRKLYPLHPQFGQLWYGQNEETGDWLEEISAGGIVEMGDNIITGESASPYRFMLTSIQNVKEQPSTAGTLVVTTTGGTEASANKVVVKGINSAGEYVEETLSSGSSWSTLTSTTSWSLIESISKYGGTFTRTITCTRGSVTVLTLLASEYGRQYRQLELTKIPTAAIDFQYRFYRKPLKLVNDYDMPQIPEEYDDILVYGSLIDMQGVARPEPSELKEWIRQKTDLIDQMQKQYQQVRSVNGRNSYINYVTR
jgi:hypothetical protein